MDNLYERRSVMWKVIRATLEGKQGVATLIGNDSGLVAPMYRADKSRLTEEAKTRQAKFFGRGVLIGATERTLDSLHGMIFAQDTKIELPTAIEGMKENADGAESSIDDMISDTALETLTTARTVLLLEPRTSEDQTIAEAEQNLPKILTYKAEDFPDYRVENGKLFYVELLETYWDKSESPPKQKQQSRIIQLDDEGYAYSCIMRDGEKYGEDIYYIFNGEKIKFLPLVVNGTKNNKPSYDMPLLIELAYTNIQHYREDCMNQENLEFSAAGMRNVYLDTDEDTLAEANPNGLDVGPHGLNLFGKDDKVELLQLQPVTALQNEMQLNEKRMVMQGAQIVMDQSSNVKVGVKNIENGASMSQLKRMAIYLGQAYQKVLRYAAMSVGANPDDVAVRINTSFITDKLTSQDVLAVFAGVQAGYLPESNYYEAVVKANYTDKSVDSIQKEIEEGLIKGEGEELARLRLENEQLRAAANGDSQ